MKNKMKLQVSLSSSSITFYEYLTTDYPFFFQERQIFFQNLNKRRMLFYNKIFKYN